MQLRRLFIRNFLAVGDEPVEIFFDTTGGITLIRGHNQDVSAKSSNGAGKSAIIEAIYFSFTGSTLRKLNLDGIVHNSKTNDCVVEIEFDNVKIIRTITKKGVGSVKLFVDDVPKTTGGSKETKKLIDDIVGLNSETLSNILIFGQHNIVSFLDAGEKEKREIIENLMNLREYNQYEENARECLKEAKSKLKVLIGKHNIHSGHLTEQQSILAKQEEVIRDYRNSLTIDINLLDAQIAAMPDIKKLKDMWSQYNAYIDAKQKLEARIYDLTDQRNKYQLEYNTAVAAKNLESQNKQPLIDKVNLIKGKYNILEDRLRTMMQEIVSPLEEKLAKRIRDFEHTTAELRRTRDDVRPSADFDFQISSIQQQIEQQNNRINSIRNNPLKNDETCPVCYGVVQCENAHKVIETIEAEVKVLKNELEEFEVKKQEDTKQARQRWIALDQQLKQKVSDDTNVVLGIEAELATANKKVSSQYDDAKEKLNKMLIQSELDVSNFDEELSTRHGLIISEKDTLVALAIETLTIAQNALKRIIPVDRPSIVVEEIGKLQAQLDANKRSKAEKESLLDNNPYIEMINTLKGSIVKIDNDIKAVDLEIKDVESKTPYYQFWVDHMSSQGLKSFVVDQIIPTLNQQIAYWMQIIYQGAITVKFDKYFNVSMINNASKNEMIFGQGSGGERRRIDIAIMLAFRQVMKMSTGKDLGVLCFDECCENLDDEGIYRLYEAMQDLAKTNRVYVITHNPTLLGLLQSADVINVVKKDGAMKLQ